MRRRDLINFAGVAVASWPLTLWAAQTAEIPKVGLLSPGRSEGPDASRASLNSVVTGLSELGYMEGHNVTFDREFGEGIPDRLRELASELVKHRVDVIVAFSTTAARPAKQATSVIPIVGIAMADPVADDLVASLGRPGGNVTGTTFLGPELLTKRLQLLSEVVPHHSRVAVLWHPHAYSDRTMADMVKQAEDAAQTLGMQLQFVPANNPDELVAALSTIAKLRADALCIFPSAFLFTEYGRIVNTVAGQKLPTIYAAREGVELGGLISYGANLPELSRQTALYVAQILKGAKPAELPVQQPTKFELIINLKTAKSLGLMISRDLVLTADDVLE